MYVVIFNSNEKVQASSLKVVWLLMENPWRCFALAWDALRLSDSQGFSDVITNADHRWSSEHAQYKHRLSKIIAHLRCILPQLILWGVFKFYKMNFEIKSRSMFLKMYNKGYDESCHDIRLLKALYKTYMRVSQTIKTTNGQTKFNKDFSICCLDNLIVYTIETVR